MEGFDTTRSNAELLSASGDPRPKNTLFKEPRTSKMMEIVFANDLDKVKAKLKRMDSKEELTELRFAAWKRDKTKVLKLIDARLAEISAV